MRVPLGAKRKGEPTEGVGPGQRCSVPGEPTAERALLLRRESLELALYTFKYMDDVDSVITMLPPVGNINTAGYFKRSAVRDLLEKRTLEGRYEFLPPQAVRETYGPNDVIVLARGSGGGYGDPLERDPEAVARDLAEDLIDMAVARDIYGVVLAEDGSPDEAATEARRAEIRIARLAQGRPWADTTSASSQAMPAAAQASDTDEGAG